MEKKIVFLISNIDFFNKRGASYSRVMNYASALAKENVLVFLSSILFKFDKEICIGGTNDNKVRYLGEPIPLNKKKIGSIYFENFYFVSYFYYIRKVYQQALKEKGMRVFIVYPGNFAIMVVSLIYLKYIKREIVYLEKNELMLGVALNFPVIMQPLKLLVILTIKLYLLVIGLIQDIISPFFSGLIVISSQFERLYKPFNRNILKVPILCHNISVDVNNGRKIERQIFSIGYAGDINQNKDGIISFMKVLSELKNDGYNYVFHLWGAIGSTTLQKKINTIVNKYHLQNNVFFMGAVQNENIDQILGNYDLLVLPRPKNLQTRFGFATKLGEYMLSGIPVLSSDVSDNHLYIKDKKNGFIVKYNKETILAKMKDIMNMDRQELVAVGREGKKTAESEFHFINHSKRMVSFMFSIHDRHKVIKR